MDLLKNVFSYLIHVYKRLFLFLQHWHWIFEKKILIIFLGKILDLPGIDFTSTEIRDPFVS